MTKIPGTPAESAGVENDNMILKDALSAMPSKTPAGFNLLIVYASSLISLEKSQV